MKNLYRVLVSALSLLMMMLAMLLLAGCNGAPGCPQAGFGNSSACQPGGGGNLGGGGTGGSGGGGGGSGNPTPTAFVYAVDQGTGSATTGTIDGYDLSTSAGKFVALSNYAAPVVPGTDTGEGMVVVNKKFLYTIFELTGEIAGWSIDSSSGDLTVLSGFPILITLNLPINSPGQFQMTTDPGGNYLFISSTLQNDIYVFAIDSTSGALTLVPGAPFSTVPAGIVPGNITTDGLGRFLYVCTSTTHEGGSFIGYTIGTGGLLTLIPGIFGSGNTWQLEGDASGRYLIGTSGETQSQSGEDDLHLYVYSIDQNTGVASQATGSPFTTTYSPYTIAMQPASSNGEFIYTFGINDTATGFNPIEGYQLDTTTGLLKAITGSPFSNNVFLGQWGQFDQSGANLLVYSNVLTSGGFVTQLGPMAVASDGTLTDPISPITLVTSGYWVVTNP